MKWFLGALLLVIGVLLFTLTGYFVADREYNLERGGGYDLQCAVEAGALGLGLAACTPFGLLILAAVRSKRLTQGLAVLLLTAACIGSFFIMAVSNRVGMRAFSVDYRGKEAFGEIIIYLLMGFGAVVGFFVFLAFVASAANETTAQPTD